MSKQEKLEQRARNSPGNMKLEEFVSLLQLSGWNHLRTTGGHQIWASTEGQRFVATKDRSGNVPQYQVKEYLATLDKERVTSLMRDFKHEFSKRNDNPETLKAASATFMKTLEKHMGDGKAIAPVRTVEARSALLEERPTNGSKKALHPDKER